MLRFSVWAIAFPLCFYASSSPAKEAGPSELIQYMARQFRAYPINLAPELAKKRWEAESHEACAESTGASCVSHKVSVAGIHEAQLETRPEKRNVDILAFRLAPHALQANDLAKLIQSLPDRLGAQKVEKNGKFQVVHIDTKLGAYLIESNQNGIFAVTRHYSETAVIRQTGLNCTTPLFLTDRKKSLDRTDQAASESIKLPEGTELTIDCRPNEQLKLRVRFSGSYEPPSAFFTRLLPKLKYREVFRSIAEILLESPKGSGTGQSLYGFLYGAFTVQPESGQKAGFVLDWRLPTPLSEESMK